MTEEAGCGTQAKPLQLLVDRAVLFDEEILSGQIGFGLIVVIVGDEVFDVIVRKKTFEFAVELRGQCFVVRHNQCGLTRLFDHLCHRIGFAAACDTQECLILITFQDRITDRFNGLRLVTGGLVRAAYRKFWHRNTPIFLTLRLL